MATGSAGCDHSISSPVCAGCRRPEPFPEVVHGHRCCGGFSAWPSDGVAPKEDAGILGLIGIIATLFVIVATVSASSSILNSPGRGSRCVWKQRAPGSNPG